MKQKLLYVVALGYISLFAGCRNNHTELPVIPAPQQPLPGGLPVRFEVNGIGGKIEAKVGQTVLQNGQNVPKDTKITFTAKPDTHYAVKAWEGADQTGNGESVTLTVTQAVDIKLSFEFIGALTPYPAEQAKLYTSAEGAKASGGIGRMTRPNSGGDVYSVQIASSPYEDKYVTVGSDDERGSYRIPSLIKVMVDGRPRLIAAFDVRYRGKFTGNGDVGQSGAHGSDITVLYSDDGGKTWKEAKNKNTQKKPAIDVKNTYGPTGDTGQALALDTDVCDPCLLADPNTGTIYCGMGGGTGFVGNDWNRSNFRIFKSTNHGETWEEDTDSHDSYAKNWRPQSHSISNPKGNLTCPGHGIVLDKDVPGTDMHKGTLVYPCQIATTNSKVGVYLSYGKGSPNSWSGFTTWDQWDGSASEEGQICQLDDGSLLLAAKNYTNGGQTGISRYNNGSWTHITNDAFNGGSKCQASILKVAEGEKGKKCGVVAVCRSLSPTENASSKLQGKGRGNITVGFARDLTLTNKASDTAPLDNTKRYYINLRQEGMSYFGYSDMVMINDHTLGIIYENWWYNNDNLDGMRFITIDISKIIEELSKLPD